MAVLTWRNVDAPSGGAGLSGLDIAGRLLGNAGTGLSDALGNFGAAQTTLANNAAAQAASQYQDPAALKAALANGSLLGSLQGVDPSRVSASTIGDIQGQVGKLLNNATTQQTLDQTAITNARSNSQADALASASPAIAHAALASLSGDQKGAAAALADPSIAHLTPSQINDQFTKAQSLLQGKASLTGTNIANDQSSFNLAVGKRNDAAMQDGQAAAVDAINNGGDAIGASTILNSDKYKNLTPAARAIALQLTNQNYGNVTAPIGSPSAAGMGMPGAPGVPGAGAAPGGAQGALNTALGIGGPGTSGLGGAPAMIGNALDGTPGTANGGTYNVTYGNTKTDVPLTTMAIGDITKKGGLQDQLLNNPSLKNSPVGAYQINQATLKEYAAKTLGADWQNKIFTPEVQDQIAQKIFDDNKNGNLVNRWSSLSKIPGADKPGAFANVSWDQMKQLIQQHEGTAQASNGQDLKNSFMSLYQGLGTTAQLQQQRIDQNQTGVETAIAAGAGVKSDPGTEANKLIASNPAFKGADPGWLTDEINMVTQKAGVNPAQASALITQHLQSNHGAFKTALAKIGTLGGLLDPNQTNYSPNLPSGQRIDDSALAADINTAPGELPASVKATMHLDQTNHLIQQNQQIQSAQAALAMAASQLYQARQLAARNPNFAGLARYEQQYAAAAAQARILQATGANNATVNYPGGFNPPAAIASATQR
jgi:hypothetical protein